MSLRLLIAEDSQSKMLVHLLRDARHGVLTVSEAGLRAKSDLEVMDRARSEDRVLLTRNCSDFLALHSTLPDHPGVLAVYEDAVRGKNLSYAQIVKAIANVVDTKQRLAGQFIVLNCWSY